MLLKFRTKNFRSFRDEFCLDMEATSLKDDNSSFINYNRKNFLPVVCIYGKNGSGKSNIIRAFSFAKAFILNSQITQYENVEVPVEPFLLNDYSRDVNTEFEFEFIEDGVKYIYGFSANKERIFEEYLYYFPNKRKTIIFLRTEDEYKFAINKNRDTAKMISQIVGKNQLFFTIAAIMNYEYCLKPMRWFRNKIYFSRNFEHPIHRIIENKENKDILKSIVNIAKVADLGISDMKFEFNNININDMSELSHIDSEIINALLEFEKNLKSNGTEGEIKISKGEIRATSMHWGINKNNEPELYELGLEDESDGTRRLMSMSPDIEACLQNGGVIFIDELEKELHPLLVEFIINKFLNKEKANVNNSQLIFTTHNLDILARELLRRDEIYFVDKDNGSGISELYSLADFKIRKDTNYYKAYILGKYGAIPNI